MIIHVHNVKSNNCELYQIWPTDTLTALDHAPLPDQCVSLSYRPSVSWWKLCNWHKCFQPLLTFGCQHLTSRTSSTQLLYILYLEYILKLNKIYFKTVRNKLGHCCTIKFTNQHEGATFKLYLPKATRHPLTQCTNTLYLHCNNHSGARPTLLFNCRPTPGLKLDSV